MCKMLVFFEDENSPKTIRGALSHLSKNDLKFLSVETKNVSNQVALINPEKIFFDATNPKKTNKVINDIAGLKVTTTYVGGDLRKSIEKVTQRVDSWQVVQASTAPAKFVQN